MLPMISQDGDTDELEWHGLSIYAIQCGEPVEAIPRLLVLFARFRIDLFSLVSWELDAQNGVCGFTVVVRRPEGLSSELLVKKMNRQVGIYKIKVPTSDEVPARYCAALSKAERRCRSFF